MLVSMLTIDDVVDQFALWIAKVADNPATTEHKGDTLRVAMTAFDDTTAGRGPVPAGQRLSLV